MANNLRASQKIALFIDKKQITEYVYDEILGETDNTIVLSSDMMVAWYDKNTGKEIHKLENLVGISWYKHGIIVNTAVNKYSLYSLDGSLLLLDYTFMCDCGKYFTVYIDKKCGLYDAEKKQMIIPVDFDNIHIEPDYILVTQENKEGIYSSDGNKIVPVIYQNIRVEFNRGDIFFVVTNDINEKGVYSYEGKGIIPVMCNMIHFITNKYIIVSTKNGYRLYSGTGEVLYKNVSYYQRLNSHVLIIGDMTKTAYSLKNGTEIVSNVLDIIDFQDMLLVIENNKIGLYSYEGKELLPCEYNYISETDFSGIFRLNISGSTQFYIIDDKKIIAADAVKQDEATKEMLFLIYNRWLKYRDIR